MRGATLEADLALRDFTVNAIAEPVAGGAPIDPLGGLADIEARRLRMGQRSKRCLSSMKNSLLSRIGAGARGGTLPDAESNADRGQPGRGGRKLQSFRRSEEHTS